MSYKDKLFSILGDSISTLEGYSIPDFASYYMGINRIESNVLFPEDTWWGQVIEYLGGQLLVNNSFSGSMVCMPIGAEIESFGCSDERTSGLSKNGALPDVVMVFMGTNDWGAGKPLFPDDMVNKKQNPEIFCFSTAYKLMIEKLIKNYPNAELWCFTPPFNPDSINYLFELPNGRKRPDLEDYCKIIREVSMQFGCKIIDLNPKITSFETVDKFHPTDKGMKTISDGIIDIISNN